MMIEEHGIPNRVGQIGKKEDLESIGKVEKGRGTYRDWDHED